MDTWSTPDAAHLAGVSERQIHYWVHTHVIEPTVPPAGSGSRARWTRDDIARLRLAAVVARRCNLARARCALAAVDDLEHGGHVAFDLHGTDTVGPVADTHELLPFIHTHPLTMTISIADVVRDVETAIADREENLDDDPDDALGDPRPPRILHPRQGGWVW